MSEIVLVLNCVFMLVLFIQLYLFKRYLDALDEMLNTHGIEVNIRQKADRG